MWYCTEQEPETDRESSQVLIFLYSNNNSDSNNDITNIKHSKFFTPEEEEPDVIFDKWRMKENLYW